MKKLSNKKPLAAYAPAKADKGAVYDTTIERITKEAHANIMGVIDKIEKHKNESPTKKGKAKPVDEKAV